MENKTPTYRGHQLSISRKADTPRLLIDGEAIPVSQITKDQYATVLLPHSNFTSLDELAHAVIDHAPQFNGRRDIT